MPQCCFANDTLNRSQQLFLGQSLVSAGSAFELGFLSLGNSNRLYVGIWYRNIIVQTVIWVANREMPLAANDSGSSLAIGSDGNLRLAGGKQNIVWSSNASIQSNNTLVMLSDAGNLVIKDSASGALLWESFNHPANTMLPGMMLGFNTRTGEEHSLLSWNTVNDPSPGNFTLGLSVENPPQGFIWKGSEPYWRSGPWDGWKFQGIPDQDKGYTSGFYVIPNNQQGTVYFTFNTYNSSVIRIMVITPTGSLKILQWEEGNIEWTVFWEAPKNPCDIYGACGPAAVCNINKSPICNCLKGHVPKFTEEWSKGIWNSGCTRRAEFQCEKDANNSDLSRPKSDGFLRLSGIKLPDHYQYIYDEDSAGCKQQCLNNCSCVAYAYPDGIGCMVWTTGLVDLQKFSFGGEDIFLRLSNSEFGSGRTKVKLISGFTAAAFVILLIILAYIYCAWKGNQRGRKSSRMEDILLNDRTLTPIDSREKNSWEDRELSTESSELPLVDFLKISTATCGFSNSNKLGEGGFGPVYRGKLEDGQEIAVKRLSSLSGQGNEEFKNEIVLISKLQHRNLVRLLGCSIHGEEKLIIYEYMKNKSLDSFLFDPTNKLQLGWTRRFNIIQGIARGLLYLHRDSCLRVIHRDLKASNILLDDDMNPKISDFGLARTFQATQTLGNTKRVVGTFGYMAPEYAMGGLFSEKSDVYSFGVLLLEVVSGRRNIGMHHDEKHLNLIGHAWKLWSENIGLDIIDQSMANSCSPSQVMRCMNIGLLCVEDHAADRPTMATIVLMLSSETDLPQPKQPTFPFRNLLDSNLRTTQSDHACSMNEVSISMLQGR